MNKASESEFIKFYFTFFKKFLITTSSALIVMFGFRLFAHLYYGNLKTSQFSWVDLTKVYWMGLRFDLSALAYIFVIPVLVTLIVSLLQKISLGKSLNQFLRIYLFFFLLALALVLAIDTGYFSYFQDHLNIMIFALFEDDTMALLRTFLKNYPVGAFILLLILFAWGLKKFLWWQFSTTPSPASSTACSKFQGLFLESRFSLLLYVLPLALVALSARGSLTLFPLSLQDTVVTQNSFLNHLTYNGFHALIRALKLRNQQRTHWNANAHFFGYEDSKQAFADYFEIDLKLVPSDPLQLFHHKTKLNPWAAQHPPHVLVLVMESFGSAYLPFESNNFEILGELKKHFDTKKSGDFLTLNFLPSNASTIGSLSSLMIGLPQRPTASFLTESEYLQVPFRTSPARIFKNANYQTRFVYGGNPGWRDINKFAGYQGFESVEGDVNIENTLGQLSGRHSWGVYDEDLYAYLKKTLLESQKPQLILTMTTTNHPPYELPESYHPAPLISPPELNQRLLTDHELVQSRFRAYQYANQKLGEFLTWLKNSELRDQVIVAVTGDHSFWMVNFDDNELLQKWGVPFYLYIPKPIRPSPIPQNVFGSHFDIWSTLYPLALSEVDYDGIGKNLLDPQQTNESFALFSGNLAFNSQGGLLAGKGMTAYTPYRWDPAFVKVSSGTNSASLDRLDKKYKSLMSLLDFYFKEEKLIKKDIH